MQIVDVTEIHLFHHNIVGDSRDTSHLKRGSYFIFNDLSSKDSPAVVSMCVSVSDSAAEDVFWSENRIFICYQRDSILIIYLVWFMNAAVHFISSQIRVSC